METKQKRSIIIILILLIFGLTSCEELGSQGEETVKFFLTTNKQYIIRHYSIYTVTSYESSGGYTKRSGYTEHYIDKIDAMTGEVLIKKSEIYGRVNTINDDYIFISLSKDDLDNISVLSIDDFSEVLPYKKIKQANNGLNFKCIFYKNIDNPNQVAVEGNDARLYSLDMTTGKASLVDSDRYTRDVSSRDELLKNEARDTENKNYRFIGDLRKKMVIKSDSAEIKSEEDFIDPYIYCKYTIVKNYYYGGNYDERKEFVPQIIDDKVLVFSSSSTESETNLEITALSNSDLSKKYSLTLECNSRLNVFFGDYKLFPIEDEQIDKFLIITKTTIGLLDIKAGAWIWKNNFDNKKLNLENNAKATPDTDNAKSEKSTSSWGMLGEYQIIILALLFLIVPILIVSRRARHSNNNFNR